jgi:predicted nucleic acid-binding protein
MATERWVIDANVLISAALLKTSLPAVLLGKALRDYRFVFSSANFEELALRRT